MLGLFIASILLMKKHGKDILVTIFNKNLDRLPIVTKTEPDMKSYSEKKVSEQNESYLTPKHCVNERTDDFELISELAKTMKK